MVKRSPCLSCTDVGPDKDKANDICLKCVRRVEYVRAIGDLSSTVSIEEASVSKRSICKTVGCSEEATPSGYCKRCQSRNWYRRKHGIPVDAPVDETRSLCAKKGDKKQVETTESYGIPKETTSEKEIASFDDSFTEIISAMGKLKSDPASVSIPEPEGYGMNIDLTDYPEVHNYFIQKAREELRSIPNQILWTLLQIVRNDAALQIGRNDAATTR